MFRLVRALVAEGLGLGGLIWCMTIFGASETPASRPHPATPPTEAFATFEPEVVTLRKPAIYASLEPPLESPAESPLTAQRPTFFRGTDSLLER